MSTPETLPNAISREHLAMQLTEPEYRRAFVEAHAKDSIAFQLRMMRKSKDWDQKQLAEHAFGDPKLQSMVSRYENPDYGKYTLNTLLDLAAAFDVALVVHFAPFSELLEWDQTPVERKLVPACFQEELNRGTLVRQSKWRKAKAKGIADVLSPPQHELLGSEQRSLFAPENVIPFPILPRRSQTLDSLRQVFNAPTSNAFAAATAQGRL